MHQNSDLPVIFLTSKDEQIDELFGLKMGAGAAFRHVGRLVPVQHVTGRIQIADFS